MKLTGNRSEATAYLLADHLDAMLASGEDLLKVHRTVAAQAPEPGQQSLLGELDALRRRIEAMRTLELALAMRGLQARERAQDLRRSDPRLELFSGLFLSGTEPLAEAARELGDWTDFDFHTGDEMVEYLRSRGMIARDTAGLLVPDQVVATPQFRVACRVELGPLLDLAATFLDALDVVYDLYADAPGDLAARSRPGEAGHASGPAL